MNTANTRITYTFTALFSLIVSSFFSSCALAAEHTVTMINSGEEGIMVFKPAVLRVNVGDTVHFEPTDWGHNSQSIEGFTPEGSVTWEGAISQKVSVTFDKEGVYVYECLPHIIMAMVGVIVVGEPVNLDDIKAKAQELSFAVHEDRLMNYLNSISPDTP